MIDVRMLEEDLELEIETILEHLDKYNQSIFQDNLEVLGFDNSLSFNYFALGIREILKNKNKDQNYWLAMGINQKIYNDNGGKFVNKAKENYNKIKDLKEDSKNLNKY